MKLDTPAAAVPLDVIEPATPALLRLTGQPAWSADGRVWHKLTRKDAVLMTLLALHGQQPRTQAAALLWPDAAPPRAHANLRQRLFRLRQQLAVLIDDDGDDLKLAATVQTDLDHPWRFKPHEACGGDELLQTLASEADGLQPWIDDARRAWVQQRAARLAATAARYEAAGDLAAAMAATEQLLLHEPLLEHAWRGLMHLHLQRGDRAAALATFERCEQVLRDELGVRPAAATLTLLHRAETQAMPAVGAEVAGPMALPPSLLRPPPFVGRVAERTAMDRAWAQGQAFMLVGEAGIGKSRLLGVWAAAHPGSVFETARAGDEWVPYGTMTRLLRALARGAERPDALWPRGAAAAELARLLPERGPAPAAPGLEALLHDAIEQVFQRSAAAGVKALLLDDLQHADPASLVLLARVVASGGPLWGLASRHTELPALAGWLRGSSRVQGITVAPLTASEQRQLLDALALPGLNTAVISPALAAHCGGNPLFMLETVKHLNLGAAGSGPHPVNALPLPASVESLLSARLAGLSQLAQSLARVAAVADADFDAAVASDVLGLPALALSDAWHALEAMQVLRGAQFVHESMRDVVLHMLPMPLREPLHAAVAASLAAQGAPPRRIAMHQAKARRWADAAAQATLAAAQARRVGDTQTQLAALDEAARWCDAAGDRAGAFAARLTAVEPMLGRDGIGAARAALAVITALAATPQERAELYLAQAEIALNSYDLDALRQCAELACAAAMDGSEEALRGQVLRAAALARSAQPEAAAESRALLASLAPQLARMASPLLAVRVWSHVAVVQHAAGQPEDCVAALECQQQAARECGHAELEAAALASLCGQNISLGHPERAVEQGRAAAAMQRRYGALHQAVLSEINLAIGLIGIYALDEALSITAAAAAHLAGAASDSDLRCIVADLRADIWLRLGDPTQALAELDASAAPATGWLPARLLNRLGLRWRAALALGDSAGLADQAANLAVQRDVAAKGGVRLRLMALRLPEDSAAAYALRLDAVHAQACAASLPAGQALALMGRLQLALHASNAGAVRAHATALYALWPRARHLYVDEAELLALLCKAADPAVHSTVGPAIDAATDPAIDPTISPAAGASPQSAAHLSAAHLSAAHLSAAHLRDLARRWCNQVASTRLPASHVAAWRARPELQPLLA